MALRLEYSFYLIEDDIPNHVIDYRYSRFGVADWEVTGQSLSEEVVDWCSEFLSGVPFFYHYIPFDYDEYDNDTRDDDDYAQIILMFNSHSDMVAFKMRFS